MSYWELGMLAYNKKITIKPSIETFVSDLIIFRNYQVLYLTPRMSDIIADYKDEINCDPADRAIAATAITHNPLLVTADSNLRSLSFVNTF